MRTRQQISRVQSAKSRRTNRHDPQTPNIDLGAVLLARDDLGGHPVRRTDHRGPFGVGRIRDLGAETKVSWVVQSQHAPARQKEEKKKRSRSRSISNPAQLIEEGTDD
jgi:hypothetical protein